MLRFRWITFDRFKVVNLSRFYRVNFIRPYWVNFTVFSTGLFFINCPLKGNFRNNTLSPIYNIGTILRKSYKISIF